MKQHKPQGKPFERYKASTPDRRPSAARRGYDAAWERLRKAKLDASPLCECEDCRGRVTPAEVVDHIIPIEQRPDLRLEWANLRSMSKRCHDRRTMRDQVHGKRKVWGCDVNGIPLDPEHPWRIYEEKSRATEAEGPAGGVTRTPLRNWGSD